MKYRILKQRALLMALAFPVVVLFSCGDDPPPYGATADTPGDYGFSTSAAIVVNPVINRGSSTTIASGSERNNVAIAAGTMPTAYTDSTGLAVISGIPVQQDLPLTFNTGSVLLDVMHTYELYDVVVSYTPSGVEYLFPPVRYPIDSAFIYVEPSTFTPAMVNRQDGAVYVFAKGVYAGDMTVTAEGVLLFGAWDEKTGPETVFGGDITVQGGNTRMRGIAVQGAITVRANTFEAAFCSFGSANISGNSVMLLRNEFTAGQATVPSSSAILVDNRNIP